MERKPFPLRWWQWHSFQTVAAISGNIPEKDVAAYVIIDEGYKADKNSVSIKKCQRWFHFMCNKVRHIKITCWL